MFIRESDNATELTSNDKDPATLFNLTTEQVDQNDEEVKFGAILSFQTRSKKFVSVSSEYQELYPHKSYISEKYKLCLKRDTKDYSGVAFLIEDVPEAQTAHVYQLSLMIPHLKSFYEYFLKTDISIEAYYENPEQYLNLQNQCSKLVKSFNSLSAHIMNTKTSKIDITKQQNALKETGVIDFLMIINNLIHQKMDTGNLLTSTSKITTTQNIDKHIGHYLKEAQKKICELVYFSIKGNSVCCQRIIKYEDDLIMLLKSNSNKHVRNILKEIFKYSNEFYENNEEKMKNLFDQLRTIAEGPDMLKEQSMFFHILKSICECNGKGVLKYQALARKSIFKPKNRFLPIKFGIYSDKPTVEFDYPRDLYNIDDILNINPELNDK